MVRRDCHFDADKISPMLSLLTNLTSLDLRDCLSFGDEEPFDTLSRIQRRSIPGHVLSNANEDPMFPSLTQLTCLEIKTAYLRRITHEVLQVFSFIFIR